MIDTLNNFCGGTVDAAKGQQADEISEMISGNVDNLEAALLLLSHNRPLWKGVRYSYKGIERAEQAAKACTEQLEALAPQAKKQAARLQNLRTKFWRLSDAYHRDNQDNYS